MEQRWPVMLVASPSLETVDHAARWHLNRSDPYAVERSNLLRMCKLVVRRLLDGGAVLDQDHVPLQHLFVVIEHVLRHGLRRKRGYGLVGRCELWELLQLIGERTTSGRDINNSVRHMPNACTGVGRCRAWLRMAVMQKRLADYLQCLVDWRYGGDGGGDNDSGSMTAGGQWLSEWYHDWALLSCDDAVHVLGLLVGLNSVDCNLCLKEQELDTQTTVIDLAMYLRPSAGSLPSMSSADPEDTEETEEAVTSSASHQLANQKNYIEELNRKLNSQVVSLQTQLDSSQRQCCRLERQLAGSAVQCASSPPDGDTVSTAGFSEILPESADKPAQNGDRSNENKMASSSVHAATTVDDRLAECLQLRQQLTQVQQQHTKLLEDHTTQAGCLSEAETARCLMETDVCEKQDTIVSLRQQLADVKTINIELYNKLQECEAMLKQRHTTVGELQQQLAHHSATIDSLNNTKSACEKERAAAETRSSTLSDKLAQAELCVAKVTADLKIEREWRQSLQESCSQDQQRVSAITQQLTTAQQQLQSQETALMEMERLRLKCADYEHTLDELGQNLSESKLKMADLRDTARGVLDGHWVPDQLVQQCAKCRHEFTISRRKHHCRNCGHVFCAACSDNTTQLASCARPVRVCDACHTFLLRRHQAM